MVPLVAQDQRATRIAYGFIRDYITGSPLLASMVEEVLSSEIALRNRVTVSCFPCTLRSLRGWSVPAGVMDEVGFWRLEGQADSDVEIQASIRRGTLNFPFPRLVKISTPYMRSGLLYSDFKSAFGQDNPDLLVWRARSVLMNPSLMAERLERERRLDPSRFTREYEAEFAEDIETFLPHAWIEGAIIPGRHDLPPADGLTYFAAVDPSGGAADSFAVSIAHMDTAGRVVQDVMRGWGGSRSSSVDLEGIVKEIATILRRYGLGETYGDKYAAGWVRERFQAEGVLYRDPEMDKSAAYLEAEPLFGWPRRCRDSRGWTLRTSRSGTWSWAGRTRRSPTSRGPTRLGSRAWR